MDTNLKGEINFLIKPLAILSAIVLLLILVVVVGMNNVNKVRAQISSNKTIESQLGQKVLALETVTINLPGDVSFLDIVLPSRGAVLYGLSQIKIQAANNQLLLSGIKTGNVVPESNGLMKSSISFEVEGDEQAIYNFLAAFSNVLPLMTVDKVNFTSLAGAARAGVTLNIYSADLPKKIPSLTGAVKELTTQDINLLRELSSYQLPSFVEPVVNTVNNEARNPFN